LQLIARREIITSGPGFSAEEVLKEVRAIDIVYCDSTSGEFLIPIFWHGWLEESKLYGIDMDLCDNQTLYAFPSFHFSGFKLHRNEDTTDFNNLSILLQLSTGLEFIHRHGQVHRALSPGNGNDLDIADKQFSTSKRITLGKSADSGSRLQT
jgi:serine/threonine protein kinase